MLALRLTGLFCLTLFGLLQERAPEPFIPVGVWYAGPGVQAPEVPQDPWTAAAAWQQDLTTIRAAGFTSITTWTTWGYTEPIRGRYRFDAVEQMLRLAGEAGLLVHVEVLPEPAPEWHTGPPCAPNSPLHAALVAVHTRVAPYPAALERAAIPAIGADDGCPPLPALTPKPAHRPALAAQELAFALDSLRAGADTRGWRLTRLQGAQEVAGDTRGPDVTDADLRLWTWAALARGARGIWFEDWSRMTGPGGAPSRGALAAGALAANLFRNARLFTSVVPRTPVVAVLHGGDDAAAARLHAAAFARNLPVDLVRPGELLSGAASRYRVLLVDETQPPVVRQALKGFEQAGGRVLTDPSVLDGLTPDIRVSGAAGVVEARILESPDAWLIVAINHADTPQAATLAFERDLPEAIWVDMETGNSFTFVQSPSGPSLTHTFPARDVLVLVRNKRLR